MFPTLFKGVVTKPVARQIGKGIFDGFWKDFVEQAAVDEANDRFGTNVNTAPSIGGGAATLLRKTIKPSNQVKENPVTIHIHKNFPHNNSPPSPQPQNGNPEPSGFGNKPFIGAFEKTKVGVSQFYKIDNKKNSARDRLFCLVASMVISRYGSMPEFCDYIIERQRARIYNLTEEEALAELAALREMDNRQYSDNT